MSKKKVPIALRNPDAILLVYGDVQLRLDMGNFDNYMVVVDEDKVHDFEPYMVPGVKDDS